MRHFRDSHTRKRMASAHARHASYCSCGKIVHGNGGHYQHRAMHERRGDDHRYVSSRRYEELFPRSVVVPQPKEAK